MIGRGPFPGDFDQSSLTPLIREMAINLRQLRYFARIVEAGNITRAAEQLFVAQPDFVVPLVIMSPETTGMLGAAQVAAMKRDAWLVNCSRGEVVDEAALADALAAG